MMPDKCLNYINCVSTDGAPVITVNRGLVECMVIKMILFIMTLFISVLLTSQTKPKWHDDR